MYTPISQILTLTTFVAFYLFHFLSEEFLTQISLHCFSHFLDLEQRSLLNFHSFGEFLNQKFSCSTGDSCSFLSFIHSQFFQTVMSLFVSSGILIKSVKLRYSVFYQCNLFWLLAHLWCYEHMSKRGQDLTSILLKEKSYFPLKKLWSINLKLSINTLTCVPIFSSTLLVNKQNK